MKKGIKSVCALALSAAALCSALSSCANNTDADEANQGEVQTLFDLENNVLIPDSGFMIASDGSYSFSLFSNRFVSVYNQIMADKPQYMLPEISDVEEVEDKTPYFEYDSYRCELKPVSDENNMPSVTIYTPKANSSIYEMRLTLDENEYKQENYDTFKQMSLCTFRIMLPECPDSALTNLFEALYASAYDNDYSDGYKRPPQSVYRTKNVGIFSYIENGRVNISFIPLDELFFASVIGGNVRFYDIATKKNYDDAEEGDNENAFGSYEKLN